ncbi:MAG TPA: hypothetical protein DHW63_02090 [Hyphomonadaceae bacterium]|nr:hypothetical protein [Hyphomonadaceae bacterium]
MVSPLTKATRIVAITITTNGLVDLPALLVAIGFDLLWPVEEVGDEPHDVHWPRPDKSPTSQPADT